MIAGILLALQIARPPRRISWSVTPICPDSPTDCPLSGSYIRADLLATALGGTAGSLPQGRTG